MAIYSAALRAVFCDAGAGVCVEHQPIGVREQASILCCGDCQRCPKREEHRW